MHDYHHDSNHNKEGKMDSEWEPGYIPIMLALSYQLTELKNGAWNEEELETL